MAKYTAVEMRSAASYVETYEVFEEHDREIAVMLRQSADILESIRNEISIIEKMPTAELDGSFENQKINGERLMAKIAFYEKVKEIVAEVSNV